MGWTEVTETSEITRLHGLLHQQLVRSTRSGGTGVIGWPRGSFQAQIRVVDITAAREMWVYNGRHGEARDFVTYVGRRERGHRGSLLIDLQFNFASGRFNRMKGGAFVLDAQGNPWLAHRAIVTRGTSRLNREELLEVLDWRKPVSAASDVRPFQVELLPVARLDGKNLVHEILKFAVAMREAATLVALQQPAAPAPGSTKGTSKNTTARKGACTPNKLDAAIWQYRDEFSGTRVVSRKGDVVMEWTHGKVVKALHAAVKSTGNVQKSQAADLIVCKKSSVHLYEVKPSSSSQSIYTAIGQLVFNAATLETQYSGQPVRKFLVLPASKGQKERHERCRELGFELVTFRAEGGGYSFDGLP